MNENGFMDPFEKFHSEWTDVIRETNAKAVELHRSGMADRRVVREVFPMGNGKDRWIEILTQGEFSRVNFVRAAIRYAPRE